MSDKQPEQRPTVTVKTSDAEVKVDGAVTPRELYEGLGAVHDKVDEVKDDLSKIRTALIVLAILAAPKFAASAIDVFTGAAQAFIGH